MNLKTQSVFLYVLTLVCIVGCVATYLVTSPHDVPAFLENITLILVGASTGVTVPSTPANTGAEAQAVSAPAKAELPAAS